jgi:energy-converting hydrogenase Eha subunit A
MAQGTERLTAQATRCVAAALVLHLVLIQPNHPAAMTWGALLLFPLELPVLLLFLVACPTGRWAVALRTGLTVGLTAIVLLKAADYAMFTALGRGFNPVADLPLIEAGLRLLIGSVGLALALIACIAAVISACALAVLIWWATGVWARISVKRPLAVGSALAASGFCLVAIMDVGRIVARWDVPLDPPGAAFTARVGVERIVMARETLANLQAFDAAARKDAYAERDGLLNLIDRDVLVVFVESYGRASFDTPLYAGTHLETLNAAQDRLSDLGLSMRSGWLDAPTRGGQSWLSHATFANGLWIADQSSYGAALVSGRQTLFHMAQRSGFATAAVMPQITLDWPEAEFMGFDTILAAADLGYEGAPFNWVTMPDQFTFSALDRLLRDEVSDQPLFAQIALGSSHAPWTPVPELVGWDEIGDGRIFSKMAQAGDPPDVVWRDRDRVRRQYRKAVDYALQVVFDYAARHASEPPLMIVVGDHQAAEFVALDERSDVPIHIVGPKALVDRFANAGWTQGLVPDPLLDVSPMSRMRDLILDTFTGTLREGSRS